MDVVVRGRHIEVSDRFRDHASHKLAKLEKYDGKCHRIDVAISQEMNPRLADQAVRVELTCHGKGPVIRAEASATEKYAALDLAFNRLEERMRRAADRRHDHHHRGSGRNNLPRSHEAEVVSASENGSTTVSDQAGSGSPVTVVGEGPLVVREKTHATSPMSLDQALYEMELVGHDFFLFQDSATDTPSLVYRRRGYDYGVLHLKVEGTP